MKATVLDIHSRSDDPLAKGLSNFIEYHFVLDGVRCASMEGFLQSLKFEDPTWAARLRSMVGYQAFKVGQEGNGWKDTQLLYWQGSPLARASKGYQELLDRAYAAWYEQNPRIAELLIASVGKQLRHTMGKNDPTDSVLVELEYISRLERLRFRALDEGEQKRA